MDEDPLRNCPGAASAWDHHDTQQVFWRGAEEAPVVDPMLNPIHAFLHALHSDSASGLLVLCSTNALEMTLTGPSGWFLVGFLLEQQYKVPLVFPVNGKAILRLGRVRLAVVEQVLRTSFLFPPLNLSCRTNSWALSHMAVNVVDDHLAQTRIRGIIDEQLAAKKVLRSPCPPP